MEYPNRQRMSKLVATEMRLFNSRAGMQIITWSTAVTIWLKILFSVFYYFNGGRDRKDLVYVSLLVIILAVYFLAIAVKRAYFRANGATYEISMYFISLSFLASAVSAYLFFCTAWFWSFDGVIPGGSATIIRFVGAWSFIAPAAVLFLYMAALLFEPNSYMVRGGRLYWLTMLLPVSAEAVTVAVGLVKFAEVQARVSKILATVCITLLLVMTVRYAVKGTLYIILNKLPVNSNAKPLILFRRSETKDKSVDVGAAKRQILKLAQSIKDRISALTAKKGEDIPNERTAETAMNEDAAESKAESKAEKTAESKAVEKTAESKAVEKTAESKAVEKTAESKAVEKTEEVKPKKKQEKKKKKKTEPKPESEREQAEKDGGEDEGVKTENTSEKKKKKSKK